MKSKTKKKSDFSFIVLVGDIDYFKRFNFKKIKQPVELIGPVNPDRVLLLSLDKTMLIDELEIIKFL